MSSLQKLFNHSKDVRQLCSRLSLVNFGSQKAISHPGASSAACKLLVANIHTSRPRYDLMEFFDTPKNWAENEVRSGRAWRADELRIKSNSDLHKLWFVLLKERNMLKTMEHECEVEHELFPSPERIDKVEESMHNLETVVRERNRAYHLLETGRDGERPGRIRENVFALEEFYSESEHRVPREHNEYAQVYGSDVRKFLRLYKEKATIAKTRARHRNRNQVTHLLRRFPNIDRDLLRSKYPDVDINRIERLDKARGHFAPKIEK